MVSKHDAVLGLPAFVAASRAIEQAVVDAVGDGDATRDVGGRPGTAATGRAAARRLGV